MGDLTLFAPEATVLVGALVTLVLSMIGSPYRVNWTVSVVMALLGVGVSIAWLRAEGEPFFPGIYRVDAFSQLLKIGITTGLLLTVLVAGNPGSVRERSRIDVPLFLFFSAVGMMMMVSATELVTLYVALELSAYGLYVLAALNRHRREGYVESMQRHDLTVEQGLIWVGDDSLRPNPHEVSNAKADEVVEALAVRHRAHSHRGHEYRDED